MDTGLSECCEWMIVQYECGYCNREINIQKERQKATKTLNLAESTVVGIDRSSLMIKARI